MRINNVSLLRPEFGVRLYQLMKELGALGSKLAVFETVRAPERQNELHAAGRSRARAYQSAHQFGLGADIVFCEAGLWTWPPADDPRWEPLTTLAPKYGLETLSFERPHVQIRDFDWRKLTPGPADAAGWMAWLQRKENE